MEAVFTVCENGAPSFEMVRMKRRRDQFIGYFGDID